MNRPHASRCGIRLKPLLCALLMASTAAYASQEPVQTPAISNGAQIAPPACAQWGGKPLARTELFFGLTRPDGTMVSTDDFQKFVDQEVTPRFPAGLTLLGGNGQFRNASGTTVKEGSKLLILLYAYDRESSGNIETIRAAYTSKFRQESVLRVDGSSCVLY